MPLIEFRKAAAAMRDICSILRRRCHKRVGKPATNSSQNSKMLDEIQNSTTFEGNQSQKSLMLAEKIGCGHVTVHKHPLSMGA